MPNLTIFAGPNGSGKSTLTETLDPAIREHLLDPDAIAKRIDPEDPARAALMAGRETLRRTQEYLEAGASFAMETTLSSKNNLRTMQDAKARGFFVELIYICRQKAMSAAFKCVRCKLGMTSPMRMCAGDTTGVWRTCPLPLKLRTSQ